MTRLVAARTFILALDDLLERASHRLVADFVAHLQDQLRERVPAEEIGEDHFCVFADFDELDVKF